MVYTLYRVLPSQDCYHLELPLAINHKIKVIKHLPRRMDNYLAMFMNDMYFKSRSFQNSNDNRNLCTSIHIQSHVLWLENYVLVSKCEICFRIGFENLYVYLVVGRDWKNSVYSAFGFCVYLGSIKTLVISIVGMKMTQEITPIHSQLN